MLSENNPVGMIMFGNKNVMFGNGWNSSIVLLQEFHPVVIFHENFTICSMNEQGLVSTTSGRILQGQLYRHLQSCSNMAHEIMDDCIVFVLSNVVICMQEKISLPQAMSF